MAKRRIVGTRRARSRVRRPGTAGSRTAHVPPPLTRKQVTSWDEFMRQVGPMLDGGWLFRGVSRTTFTLVPSIGRRSHAQLSALGSERELLNRFKREVRPYLAFQPGDDWEWLAIAQHHGVPTRLIDWSETPLIAAYFAVWEHDDSHGGVYAVRQPAVRENQALVSPFDTRDVHYFYPGHVTRRITSQRGLFTVHPSPELEYSPDGALLFEIPDKLKPEFRVKLDGLGVNHASVFPDIDGLSRHLAWVYRGKETVALKPATAAIPRKERERFDPSDPQKGAWGGEPRQNGWVLDGRVTEESRGWYRITLTVHGTGKKRLTRPVAFYLHDSFQEPEQTVRPLKGSAKLEVWAYGAFTVGAHVNQDGTRLELDLSTVATAPAAFRTA